MFSSYQIQHLIDLPIEEVAERLGLRVRRHVSLCPFHQDKRPSLHFNTAKNRYRCYVCGAYGRSIDLVMNYLHLNFVDACNWLADENNIILTQYKAAPKSPSTPHYSLLTTEHLAQFVAEPVLTDEARRFLFEERRLDPRVIQWCQISSTHTDLLIPYFDAEGKFVSVQWRSLHPQPSTHNLPRFRFAQGCQCSIYNLQILRHLKPDEPLWITEGCSDCWAMLSCGRKAIAIPSATLLKEKELAPLKNSIPTRLNLHIFPDNDAPGERLFLQLREQFPQIERHQLPAGCKDFAEAYVKMLTC